VSTDTRTERRCTKVERSVHTPLQPFELEDDMAKKATKIEKAMSKSAILTELADRTELSRKQVGRVLEELTVLIAQHVGKRSVGTFTLPGLLKIKVVQRPARPARKGVPNPFRPGETMDVAAKPASRKVKVLPLMRLKAMVA
jgi:nucleoid DNA-binding protein